MMNFAEVTLSSAASVVQPPGHSKT